MVISGPPLFVIEKMNELYSVLQRTGTDNITTELRLLQNGEELVVVEKNTLNEITEVADVKNAFVIERKAYTHFRDCYFAGIDPKIEAEPIKQKTKAESTEQVNARIPSKAEQKKEIIKQKRVSLETELFVIEDHKVNCVLPHRSVAVAIKDAGENKYSLFYRSSIEDRGRDTNFRRYVSEQDGSLVAYRYINEVEYLRAEFKNMGLSLRHNGQNLLSKDQCVQFLSDISRLLFI